MGLMALLFVLMVQACRDIRIHEHEDWEKYFVEHGIDPLKACFILRDNNHETVHYFNKDRCLEGQSPASTFKIFSSLAALESVTAPNEQMVIAWDSVERDIAEWNQDLTMRQAFQYSSVPYYQELVRRIGPDYMQHYLDTANYGNKRMGGPIDQFWLNDTLKISADEQLGLVKRLYFSQLPFSDRSQRIVKSMMVQEDTHEYRLYYKTGWGQLPEKQIIWVVGFAEKMVYMKEHENSMNKSDVRMYPYFFAMNFDLPNPVPAGDWAHIRLEITQSILREFGILPQR